MVKEGIVLEHQISYKGLEVNIAKIETTKKLPLNNVKGIAFV